MFMKFFSSKHDWKAYLDKLLQSSKKAKLDIT